MTCPYHGPHDIARCVKCVIANKRADWILEAGDLDTEWSFISGVMFNIELAESWITTGIPEP